MERSAITDYIFPQRKLELIWPVTHMPGCQLQHTTPDTTPRWAQLAAALPTHGCGPQGPCSERRCPHRNTCICTHTRYRQALKCTHTHMRTHAACTHVHTHVHAELRACAHTCTCTLGMPQQHSGLGQLSKSFGSKLCKPILGENPMRVPHPGTPGWLRRLSSAFGSGHDPGVLGLSPTPGSLHGACFSLCLCLCLSL